MFVFDAIGGVIGFFAGNKAALVALLVFVAVTCGVGSLVGRAFTPRSIRRDFGPTLGSFILGVGAIGAGAMATWHYRRRVGRFALAFIGGTCAVVALGIMWASPQGLRPAVIIGLGTLFVAGLWTLHDRTKGRTIADMVGDWLMQSAAQRGVQRVLPGATVPRVPTLSAGGTMTIPIQLPAGSRRDQLDPQALETSLARANLPIPVTAVDVLGGADGGTARALVSSGPAEDPWKRLLGFDNTWPGPSSTSPKAPLNLGVTVPAAYSWDSKLGWHPLDLEAAHNPLETLVVPPKVPHLLLGGTTGGGKTEAMAVAWAELAFREHVQFLMLDPGMVEFGPTAPRALKVALGTAECYYALRWVSDQLDRRAEWMTERGIRSWRVGIDGPWLYVFIDEWAYLANAKAWTTLPFYIDGAKEGQEMPASEASAACEAIHNKLTAMARKYGIRLVTGTQRPSVKVMALEARDNYGFRLGMAHESGEGVRMTLGADAPDATKIPLSIPGGALARITRGTYWPARSYHLVPEHPDPDDPDQDVAIALAEIAAKTAHLRSTRLFYDDDED